AGRDGGLVVAAGSPAAIAADSDSLTARYLRHDVRMPGAPAGRLERSAGWITIVGAAERNLKSISPRTPPGCLTCVSGGSGAGEKGGGGPGGGGGGGGGGSGARRAAAGRS